MTIEIKGFGKITASKEVLNALSLLAMEARDSYENRGRNAMADEASRVSDTIFEKLNDENFYN